VEGAGGDGDVGVDERALAVGGRGDDLSEVGVEGDAGFSARAGADEVGDVKGGVGDGTKMQKGLRQPMLGRVTV
jgi:hypothetical protein